MLVAVATGNILNHLRVSVEQLLWGAGGLRGATPRSRSGGAA